MDIGLTYDLRQEYLAAGYGEEETAEFDREAMEFAEAVASAIRAVESAVPGARVVEVHREHDIAAAG